MTSPSSPEDVLLTALRARDEHDHAAVTALADPESVREHFERYCDISRPKTRDWFAEHMPADTPRHVVDEVHDQHLKAHGTVEQMHQFRGLGVSSHAELVALGPQEYLTRRMLRDDYTWDLVRRLRKHGRPVPPALLGTSPGTEYVVLGGVYETPDLVHLLVRFVTHRGQAQEQRGPVTRVPLRRQVDGEWRLLVESHRFLDMDWPERVTIIDEEYADLYDDVIQEYNRDSGRPASPQE